MQGQGKGYQGQQTSIIVVIVLYLDGLSMNCRMSRSDKGLINVLLFIKNDNNYIYVGQNC